MLFFSIFFFASVGRNAAGKGTNYAYQGVEPSNGLAEDDYIRHAYYQWVPFVLFLQGTMIKDFIRVYGFVCFRLKMIKSLEWSGDLYFF